MSTGRADRPNTSGCTYTGSPPETGETFTAILPRRKVERIEETLAAFVAHADPPGKKVLVLAVDRAGRHTAVWLAVTPNVVLHSLPCTAELQPVEPFRARVREVVANDLRRDAAGLRRPSA